MDKCSKVEWFFVKILEAEDATPVFSDLNWWFPPSRRIHLRW
jgi:hypothetical protein